MRLIDADALKNTLCGGIVCSECDDYFAGDNIKTNCSEIKLYFLKCIDFQEKIDAVPVIRCKDCKHRIEETRTGDLGCGFWARYVTKNGFCFMGDKGEKND